METAMCRHLFTPVHYMRQLKYTQIKKQNKCQTKLAILHNMNDLTSVINRIIIMSAHLCNVKLFLFTSEVRSTPDESMVPDQIQNSSPTNHDFKAQLTHLTEICNLQC